MPISIRRRLLIRLITAIAIGWLVAIGFVYYAAYHEVEEVFDATLAQEARVLATLMTHESEEDAKIKQDLKQVLDELGPEVIKRSPLLVGLVREYLEKRNQRDYLTLIDQKSVPGHRYELKIAFIVFDANDNVLLRSNMPGTFDEFTMGYNDRVMEDKQWRTFGMLEPETKLRVQVGLQYSVRQETVDYIVYYSLWPMLAALPLLALVIWFTVGYGLKPLQQVAVKVERRDPKSLVPISPEGVPQEVVPMVESLNRLFSRVQSALDNERQFTANAAHELRTPLAALKTITQAKQLSDTSEENQRFLRKILAGIDRTSHLLEQLLTLARMESQSMTMQHFEQVDLAKQVLEVISDIGQAAFDRNIDLSYDGDDDGVMVKGYGPALQIMIRNLIDNAIRYTPAHGSVRIATQKDPQVAKLVIEDSGPGIPSEQMSQIFQRFKRGENVDEQGSGLGLSIVQRIVKLHHGRIKMENIGADSGLRVTVQLSNADASKSYLENNA